MFRRIIALCLLAGSAFGPPLFAAPFNSAPPSTPVRLVFIHHSVGENWLDDENGGLGIALRDNNYFVSDTYYGWGPDNIGDRTDIGNWWDWFRGPHSATYLAALYAESGQQTSFSRLATSPGGENAVVIFKSCFPNSDLGGSPGDPIPSINSNPLAGQDAYSEHHTLSNAKGIYLDLLEYFRAHPEKLFLVVTAPPLSDSANAANARALNNWLVYDWLRGYRQHNVAVLDFYNILTTNGGDPDTNDLGDLGGNHHRLRNGAIERPTRGDDDANGDLSEYAGEGDDHPTVAGNLKATAELMPLINLHYNCWKGTGGCPNNALLGNLSTRAQVLTGEEILIGGFVVSGRGEKQTVVAGLGPSLAASGVSSPLANPQLQVYAGATPVADNDDWQSGSEAGALETLGLQPGDSREAATRLQLAPGAFTAHVSGSGGGTGIGQVALWDAGDGSDTAGLVNISSRARVGAGENVMIAGFIIEGYDPLTLVVRGLGPSLAAQGISDPLRDPEIQVFSGSTVIASNDDWQDGADAEVISGIGLPPGDALDAALLLTLAPGPYTVVLSGHDNSNGVGLVEVNVAY